MPPHEVLIATFLNNIDYILNKCYEFYYLIKEKSDIWRFCDIQQQNVENYITDLERETSIYIDDLEVTLYLMSQLGNTYPCLEKNEETTHMRIFAKKIIVYPEGKIIDQE